jgi:polyphosphate kinase
VIWGLDFWSVKKKSISIKRELSWLQFNERVLQEAAFDRNPLIERVHFLGIFSNNLDEFFKVRYATLLRELKINKRNKTEREKSGRKLLEDVHDRVVQLQSRFDSLFESVKMELALNGIDFKNELQLSLYQKEYLKEYFDDEIRHHIIPIIIDDRSAFPSLNDNELYLIVEIVQRKSSSRVRALIEIPPGVNRFIQIPELDDAKNSVIFLEDVIRLNLRKIFGGYSIRSVKAYDIKVVRDAEYEVEKDFSKSVFDKISMSIQQRRQGQYVRLNFDRSMPKDLLQFLLKKTKISVQENIIAGGRYHNKRDLMNFPDFGRKELRFPKLQSISRNKCENLATLFSTLKKRDIVIHFPYERFSFLLDILRLAAIDPLVNTIRISLYRVAKDSHILHALINAAQNGKRVEALVEVQARFDEEHNLAITRVLIEGGVRVIPGVPGLKVHCKVFQISRKVNGKTERITHVGTGNFHERTARVYSDISVLTAHLEIGREVRRLFDFFESNYHRPIFKHLIVSPFNSRRRLTELIQEEVNKVKRKKAGLIFLKLNALVDDALIKKLLDAAEQGVKIKAIIRGVNLLIPKTTKQKKNIEIRSILGRFLEHSRIYVFGEGPSSTCLVGSADLMTRNIDYRVEVLLPIYSMDIRKEIQDFIDLQWSDFAICRTLSEENMNGYRNIESIGAQYDSQEEWYKKLKEGK